MKSVCGKLIYAAFTP
ncbi:hypothetical protein OC503_21400 [Vibrio vulnificus]|nr:hypothetical protein [Vibrio vulnificus]MCG6262128.1 hypothetical protein [Vibrio vulnificus]MCU8361169.1 hypothetical protein [Vibrio vulnificus]MCU8365634.1 hypothetical protein [Vibrio vulnificus]MCU8369806.1 hypothetical protein [Vibrio vulnificus]MCU8448054.1 hypothetical protein [Vibrio vulnificus]